MCPPDEPVWPAAASGLGTYYNVKASAYGARGDGVTNDQPAIQAAIDAAAAAGGGTVYLPSGTYIVDQHPTHTNVCLYLQTLVTLAGDGEATIVKSKSGVTAAVTQTVSTDAGFYGCSVRDLVIDGNGNTTLGGLLLYDANFHGPFSFAYNSGTVYSGQFHRVERVTFRNISGANHAGLQIINCADCFVSECFFYRCQNGGIWDQGSDNLFENCIVGGSTAGFGMSLNPASKASNCKIYTSGSGAGTAAIILTGSGGQGAQCVNCEVQETTATAVAFTGNESKFIGGMINNSGAAVSFGAGASYNTVETSINSQTLASGTYTPATAVNFAGTNTGNVARIRTGGFTPASWIAGTYDNNLVQFNDQGLAAPQVIPFAATVTPDAYAGDTVLVGSLTAAITVANPTGGHKGSRLVIVLPQDATGGHAVTFGASYKTTAAVPTTLSTTTSIEFFHDGTNWREIARSTI